LENHSVTETTGGANKSMPKFQRNQALEPLTKRSIFIESYLEQNSYKCSHLCCKSETHCTLISAAESLNVCICIDMCFTLNDEQLSH